jgi:predicted HAD superfamily Cof-like phosphohydrolase
MSKTLEQVKEFMVACEQPVRDKPQLINKKEAELRLMLIEEEVKELREAVETDNLVEIADAFADIRYVVDGGMHSFGIAPIFETLFDEVQRSNMTKVVNGKVIRNEAGKIQKPEGYSKPDLKSIVEAAI